MEQLIKTLPAILRAGENSPEIVEAAAISAWKCAAGEMLANHALATKLTGKTLLISVSDAIWQRQLESMRAQLLFRLNSTLGQKLITYLDFKIDQTLVNPGTATNARQRTETNEDDVSLELWSAANAIHDKRLRSVFLAAASANLRSRRADQ